MSSNTTETTPAVAVEQKKESTDSSANNADKKNNQQKQNQNKQNNNNNKQGKKNKKGANVKVVKGMSDWKPEDMALRQRIFDVVRDCFRRHGAVTIQTPIAELKTTLTGKYGEDTKLIYDLADQGGEISALRYDLTVPFARYVATHGVIQIKRYQIGRVYRRDQPSRGRYREFFQCDFDIAGQYDPMIPDAECVVLLKEALEALDLKEFRIKINHRKLLDAMFQSVGVTAEDFATVCSSIDKLDKLRPNEVREELVTTKGQKASVVDALMALIANCTRTKSPKELLESLRDDESFKNLRESEQSKAPFDKAFADLSLLVTYLDAFGALDDRVTFDLSLARGLDYYTGIIYEAVYYGDKKRIGSIAGGGRYDELVGMFAGKHVPSVGFSLGVERIFTILDDRLRKAKKSLRAAHTQVYVVSIGDGWLAERMKIVGELWRNDIAAELLYKDKAKPQPQLKKADHVPLAIVFGEDEVANGTLKLKCMQLRDREDEVVTRETYVARIKALLADDAVWGDIGK